MTRFFLIIAASSGFALAAQAETPKAGAPVVHSGPALALNGDTLLIDDKHIRIWGIDTPEMRTPFGPIARARMDELIEDREVTCIVRDTDRYKRPVAVCGTTETPDLAIEMLRQGMATVFRTYTPGFPEAAEYDAAEKVGQATGKWVWEAIGKSNNILESKYFDIVFGAFFGGLIAIITGLVTAGILAKVSARRAARDAALLVYAEVCIDISNIVEYAGYARRRVADKNMHDYLDINDFIFSRTSALHQSGAGIGGLSGPIVTSVAFYVSEYNRLKHYLELMKSERILTISSRFGHDVFLQDALKIYEAEIRFLNHAIKLLEGIIADIGMSENEFRSAKLIAVAMDEIVFFDDTAAAVKSDIR